MKQEYLWKKVHKLFYWHKEDSVEMPTGVLEAEYCIGKSAWWATVLKLATTQNQKTTTWQLAYHLNPHSCNVSGLIDTNNLSFGLTAILQFNLKITNHSMYAKSQLQNYQNCRPYIHCGLVANNMGVCDDQTAGVNNKPRTTGKWDSTSCEWNAWKV